MKKIFLFSVMLLGTFGFSQTSADIGKIQLSIHFSEEQQNSFDYELLTKLDGKLTQMLSENGLVSTDYNNGLVLQPNLIINGNEVVEGGMQNVNVTNLTLQLLIRQDQTNLVFSSYSKQLKGTGRDQYSALNNAINSLSSNDPALVKFINNGTEKLLAYYQANCNQILTKSANLEKNGRYEESLALLLSIPEKASCHKTAQTKSIETYKNYQRKNCASFIKEAKMYIADKNYESAFGVLLGIDSTSPCSAESNALVKNIESKITAEDKKQWDLQMKMYNDDVALEKLRINAIKDVAVSYYKSKTRPNQTIIVK
mgnify:CR=1 FL=1